MQKCFIFTFLSLIFLSFAVKGENFKPYIIESSEDDICSLALNHYSKIFESEDIKTKGFSQSETISIPEFKFRRYPSIEGGLDLATVNFYGSQKLFVFHDRPFGIHGDVYNGYIINPNEVDVLVSELKEQKTEVFPPFYPIGSKSNSNFSWWKNVPFKFKSKWYILYEFGDFHSQNSQRKIYHLKKDGKSEKVCTIKIFQNVDDSDIKKSLPLLTAYKYSIEKMLLSSGHCGTSNPEVIPKWSGRFYSSMAVIRPWAIEPKWKFTMGNWEQQWAELQQKHFEDWKFQDIWSYREQKSNENLMFDAITELKNHYVSNYSYLEKEAYNHASKVIQAMPSRYYSLGSYYHYEKDFSVFEKILDGTYNNWKNINQDLKFKRSSIPLVALSLIVDTPQAYNRLPSAVDKNLIKSFYQKDLLMFAAHMNNFDSVKYFLEAGWPIDQVTNYEPMSCQPDLARLKRLNRSALTYATENASIEVIKLLVDAGADTKIKDSQGNNLDYYLKLNPRFSAEEKESGFDMLLEKHSKITDVKPSFSCDEKLNRLEKAICSSKGLSIYDRELNKGYKDLIASNQLTIDLKASQIAWLKRRRSECKTYSTDGQLNACLARTTRARIRYLDYIRSALNNSLHPRK